MKPPTEHQIQCAFIEWCYLNESRVPALRLAFAVPNGGYRNKATAARLKAEGVRPGVPDWMCPVPSTIHDYQFHGLAIEFKAKNGHLSDAQEMYTALLADIGWRVSICFSTEDAIKTVEGYFHESR